MWLLIFALLINAQETPEQFKRVYEKSKRLCDSRIGTINNKAVVVKETFRRGSPFEIEMQANSYETLLSVADYDCSMAESYAASAGIEMKTEEIVIPAEIHVYIPRKNAEMKSDLMETYQINKATTLPKNDPLPKVPDFKKIAATDVKCIPGGTVISNKTDFAYDRDCRAPNNISLKVFGKTKETIECAPRGSTGVKHERYKALSLCHPMLYGVIPQKNKDGSMSAQGICAFPEDFDAVSFNRSQNLGKYCETVSDYAAAQFLPKTKDDTRSFDERMLEFIARTNLKNYDEWNVQSQSILQHCQSTQNSREQESCRAIKPRVEAIDKEIQRLIAAEPANETPASNLQ